MHDGFKYTLNWRGREGKGNAIGDVHGDHMCALGEQLLVGMMSCCPMKVIMGLFYCYYNHG